MGNQKSPSVVAKRRRSKGHGTPEEGPEGDEAEDIYEDEESIQPAQKYQRTYSPVEPSEADIDIKSSSPVPQPKPKPTKKPTAAAVKKAAVKKAAAKGKNKKAASDTETEKENSELEPIHLKDNQ